MYGQQPPECHAGRWGAPWGWCSWGQEQKLLMKKTQAEELNLACHSSLGFETFSEISLVKQSSGPPRREAGMGCGFPLYREAFSQLSQHLLHKGAGSGPGTWVHFAQPTEQQVSWNPASRSPTKAKCSRGEFIPLGQSRVSGQNCCPWWQMLSPRGWGLGNVGTSLVRYLCLLSMGSPRCSAQIPAAHLEGDEHPCSGPGPPLPCLSSRHLHPPVHLSVSCNHLLPHGSLRVLL